MPSALLLLILSWATYAAAADEIRVGIVEGAQTVEVGGAPMVIRDLAGRPLGDDTPTWLRAVPRNGGIEIRRPSATGVRVDYTERARLTAVNAQGLRLNGRDYTGTIELAASGDRVVAINELPLEDYLAGAVKAEAGDRMPLEMLKAQAIVARTYAAYQRRLNAQKLYHLTASTAHQQYIGRVAADSPVWTAVRQTQGQVVLWNGQLFPAFYHTDSGGCTEDPRSVFAASGMPALKPVRVEFPSSSPYQRWRLDVPLADFGSRLLKAGISVGRIVALEVLDRSASLRVTQIAIRGLSGEVVLRGNELRRLLGYDTLKSTLFAVAVVGGVARFAGRGYGHGVGLDQWAARTMAERGWSAERIVEFYYPGVVFSRLER
ncbi:MAG TPA: SpoIID/LytB domain-containing protein [Candidatus Methylomirabilis sp.]|nr:SpoIID/LytB domain-containing protein [Candidatus Methylomirabilis sp.]